MYDEIQSLMRRYTWEIVSRKLVADHNVIPGTCSFKCKKKPGRTIRKFKARYCVRGYIQKILSLKPLNLYSPVVQWATVMLMLILQCILGLQSQIIDFTSTFVQEDIPSGEPVFIELPRYFKSDGEQGDVGLRLNKIRYGQAKAAHLWYKNLRNGLLERDFVMSKVDPCLFMSKTVICVVYVDDCLFWAHSQTDIDNVMKSIKQDGPSYDWEHSNGESVSEFLGIDIKTLDYGVFQFCQTGLIRKILEATDMEHCNGLPTRTKVESPLGVYANGSEAKRDFTNSYASVIGMMLYLTSNTRPGIYFAVHQFVQFTLV